MTRVLVIDDNVDAADSLAELLELEGYEVVVRYTGLDGLAEARAQVPDVVVCDIGLPDLDGYAVARALRAELPKQPLLVALSGYATPEDRQESKAAGFDAHLAKPPRWAELIAVLGRARV